MNSRTNSGRIGLSGFIMSCNHNLPNPFGYFSIASCHACSIGTRFGPTTERTTV